MSLYKTTILLLFLISSMILALSINDLAYGHALPDTYSIEPNAIFKDINSIPSKLVINFTERVDPKSSYIQVLNSNGERIDNDDFVSNGKVAYVTLNHKKINDGVYTVTWLAVSLDDGHVTKGSYVFVVGNVNLDNTQLSNASVQAVTSTYDAIARWPLLVSQASIFGMVLAHMLLWKGKDHDKLYLRRFTLLMILYSSIIIVSSTILLLLQVNYITNGSSIDYYKALNNVINSSVGLSWIIRIVTSIIVIAMSTIVGLIYLRIKNHSINIKFLMLYYPIILVSLSISLLSNSMISHASSINIFLMMIDWAHAMAMASWVGGLFYLSLVMIPILKGTNKLLYEITTMIPKFSIIAIISLMIISVTGMYMAFVHLNSFTSLFTTEYGKILTIKLLTIFPMVILGAYNQFIVHNKVVVARSISGNIYNDTNNKIVKRFSKIVKLEGFIGIAVLLVTSILTITPPPHNTITTYEYATTTSEGIHIKFEITPFHVGINTFKVTILNTDNNPLTNISNVYMIFSNDKKGIGPITATLHKVSEGIYSTTGGYLSQNGEWNIRLVAQRVNAYDINYEFNVNLDKHVNENSNVQTNDQYTYIAIILTMITISTIGTLLIKRVKKKLKEINA